MEMSRFFGQSVHAAFVVSDIDLALQRMIDTGVGPAFIMRRIRVAARFRGQRHDPLISAAFVYSGDNQYEFVQQHDETPSAYLEYMDRHPEGGLQHLAYFSDDFDSTLKTAEDKGTKFDVVQEFITPDGFAYEIYVEAQGVKDPLQAQLMLEGPMEAFFAPMIAAAANWNGEDPVRDAIPLLPKDMQPPTEP